MKFVKVTVVILLAITFIFVFPFAVQAKNNKLCNPYNPISSHMLSQYGIDATLGVYLDRTYISESHIPLRGRTKTIQSYLDDAPEGSTVIFEPGFFDLNTTININKPLHIVAQNHWMNPSAKRTRLVNTRINVIAENVTIEGFEMRYGYKVTDVGNSRDEAINVLGNNTRILANRFLWVGKNSVISDNTGITIQINGARRTRVENNSFERNHGVAIKTDDHVNETIIRRNNFLKTSPDYWLGTEENYPTAGEVVHLGDANTNKDANSPHSDAQRTLFERNYIQGWQVEMELMSIKSDFNIIRDNLGIDNGIGSIVVRMGHNNLIERNILIDTLEQPFRISGSGNMFRQNFFASKIEDGGPMIAIHRQMRYPHSTYPDCITCFSYLAARLNHIIDNDFVGYGSAIIWPDIVQQERLYFEAIEFVEGDPLTENNIFAENEIYSGYAERIISELNNSEAVLNINSTSWSTPWNCADVPDFNLK